MRTQKIWSDFKDELYFFILKKVKSRELTNDIFQNTFMKIHQNLASLEKEEKVKAWIFQIARNEIANHFHRETIDGQKLENSKEIPLSEYQDICCFDKFINDLPKLYKQVIELIYIKGLKQKEAAKELEISLENVKARIKRAKDILKTRFSECCQYEWDKNGKLVGESNCSICESS